MPSPDNDSAPHPPENDSRVSEQLDSPHTGDANPGLGADTNRNRPDLPADLRTPLRGFDLLTLAIFYLVAGVAIVFTVGLAAIYLFHVSRQALQNFSPAQASVTIVAQVLLDGALVALLFLIVRSRSAADFWPSVGWRAFRESNAAGVVGLCGATGFMLAVTVGIASSFLDQGKTLPMEELFRDRQSILLLTGLGVLVAPLVEETIFRGCVYPVLARSWGRTASIVATGILFGLAHALQLLPGYGQIALLMFVGIVLTYIRARTGTVVASFCVHLSYNAWQFAFLYFATGGLRHLQP